MKHFLLAICLLCISATFAQQRITTQEAAKHIGDSVTVCCKVFGGVFLDRTTSKLTLLNIDGTYPDAPFTVVLPLALRDSIGLKPEKEYKKMCFTGRIELFKDKHRWYCTGWIR